MPGNVHVYRADRDTAQTRFSRGVVFLIQSLGVRFAQPVEVSELF